MKILIKTLKKNSNEQIEIEDRKSNLNSSIEEEKKQNEDSIKKIENNNILNEENILNNPSHTLSDNKEIINSNNNSENDDSNKSSSYKEKSESRVDLEQNNNLEEEEYYLNYLIDNCKDSPIEIKMIINNKPKKMVIPINGYKFILQYIGSDIEPKNINKIIKSSLKCNIVRLLKTIKKYRLSTNDDIKELLSKKKILYLLNNDEKKNTKEIINSSNSSNEISTFKKKSNLILDDKSKRNYSIQNYCEALEEIYKCYSYIIKFLNYNCEPKTKIIYKKNIISNDENNSNEYSSDIINISKERKLNPNEENENYRSSINSDNNNIISEKRIFFFRVLFFLIYFSLMILFFILNCN